MRRCPQYRLKSGRSICSATRNDSMCSAAIAGCSAQGAFRSSCCERSRSRRRSPSSRWRQPHRARAGERRHVPLRACNATCAGAHWPDRLRRWKQFAASVCYLAELAAEGPASLIREVRYFGDLDRRGLAIPIAADIAARETGLPSVQPAVGLWKRLLEVGRRGAHPPLDPLVADRLVQWLPPALRLTAKELLVSGSRLAQEAVGMKLLTSDRTWASSLSD